MNARVSSLDVMKVVAAFFVIYIHVPISGTIGHMLVPITRVAVPFFFMISGYFIWNSDLPTLQGKVQRQMKYVLFLTIFSNLLYFVWRIVTTIAFHQSVIDYLKTVLSLKSIFYFLVLNASPFSAHLWYLNSYLYVLVIYLFLSRFNRSKAIFALIPVLLIGDLVLGKYSMVVFRQDLPNELARNFLFVGLPYFLLGIFLKQHERRATTLWKRNYFLAGYFLFSFTSILEKYVLMIHHVNATRDHYISTTFAVVCIFLYALQNPELGQGTFLERIGRDQTLTIYIAHPIFITILDVLAGKLGCVDVYRYFAPFAIFVVTLGFAVCWNNYIKPLFQYKRCKG